MSKVIDCLYIGQGVESLGGAFILCIACKGKIIKACGCVAIF